MLQTPLHPLLVHFPIVLLLLGAIVQIIAFWKKDFFDKAATYLLASGFVTGILAYLTGDGAAAFGVKHFGKGIKTIVDTHETYALITLLIFGALLVLKYFNVKKSLKSFIPLALILCIAGAFTLTMTGHYGGKMVYTDVGKTAVPASNVDHNK